MRNIFKKFQRKTKKGCPYFKHNKKLYVDRIDQGDHKGETTIILV